MWSYIRLQDCLKSIDYQFLPNGFNCVRSSTVCDHECRERSGCLHNYMVELVCSFRVYRTRALGGDLTQMAVGEESKQDAQHYRTGCRQDGWGRVSKLFLQLASTTTTALSVHSEALIQQARVDLTTSIWTLFAREFSDVYYALEVP